MGLTLDLNVVYKLLDLNSPNTSGNRTLNTKKIIISIIIVDQFHPNSRLKIKINNYSKRSLLLKNYT